MSAAAGPASTNFELLKRHAMAKIELDAFKEGDSIVVKLEIPPKDPSSHSYSSFTNRAATIYHIGTVVSKTETTITVNVTESLTSSAPDHIHYRKYAAGIGEEVTFDFMSGNRIFLLKQVPDTIVRVGGARRRRRHTRRRRSLRRRKSHRHH